MFYALAMAIISHTEPEIGIVFARRDSFNPICQTIKFQLNNSTALSRAKIYLENKLIKQHFRAALPIAPEKCKLLRKLFAIKPHPNCRRSRRNKFLPLQSRLERDQSNMSCYGWKRTKLVHQSPSGSLSDGIRSIGYQLLYWHIIGPSIQCETLSAGS